MDPLMSWRERQPSLPRPGLQFDTQSIREQEEEEEEEEEGQEWLKFKEAVTEAAMEQIPRVPRKTKQKSMIEDILKLMEKRRHIKNNVEK